MLVMFAAGWIMFCVRYRSLVNNKVIHYNNVPLFINLFNKLIKAVQTYLLVVGISLKTYSTNSHNRLQGYLIKLLFLCFSHLMISGHASLKTFLSLG